MTTYSTISQLPLPENTDALVAEQTFGDYANSLDSLLVPQYTSTTLRDAAQISGKVEGQLCAVAGELQYWDGQAWWNQADLRFVLKGVDTARTSTTTPTNDPQLSIALKSGGTYLVTLWASFVAAAAGTINAKFNWASTGGFITGRSQQFGPTLATGAAINVSTTNLAMHSLALGTQDAVGVSTTGSLLYSTMICTASADDTLNFQWAQNTLSASALTLQARSHIEYRRIS